MKIYAAGKISKGDWRLAFIPFDVQDAMAHDDPGAGYTYTCEGSIFGTHDYVGPYFVACDHGCFHGENSHGVGADTNVVTSTNGDASFARYEVDAIRLPLQIGEERIGGGDGGPYSFTQENTVGACLFAIRHCDILYAWVDDITAYGTLTEIGFAQALDKRIWIASPRVFPDLWFAYTMADRVLLRDDPVQGLRDLIVLEMPDRYQAYLQSPEWDARRRAKLKAAGHRCQLCNADDKPIHVHHRTYERIYNERPGDLIALCADCHAKFHDKVATR